MYNEMQAYLMFTRDPSFFTPDMAGMTHGAVVRTAGPLSLAGMPAGWLRNVLASYQSATSAQ